MQRPDSELNRALRSLRNQRIRVFGPTHSPEGLAFDVMGFMLTESQILQLQEAGNLHSWGIKEFAKKIEQESKDQERITP